MSDIIFEIPDYVDPNEEPSEELTVLPATRTNLKRRYRAMLMQFIRDGNSKTMSLVQAAEKVLGWDRRELPKWFTSNELDQLKWEALAAKRQKYAPFMRDVDKALLKRAMGGSVSAIKLSYQRFEGWIPETKTLVDGSLTITDLLRKIDGDSTGISNNS